ncbi:MAG: hypothetical protein AB1500_00060 [Bacillota bacterium]
MPDAESKGSRRRSAIEYLEQAVNRIGNAFRNNRRIQELYNRVLAAATDNLRSFRRGAAELRRKLPVLVFFLRSLLLGINRRDAAFALRNLTIPRRYLLVAGLIPAWLFAGLLYERFHPEAVIVRKALAAVEQPGKMTYYRVSGRLGGDVPELGDFGWEARYWFDYRRGVVRSIRGSTRERTTLTAITHLKPGSIGNAGGAGRTYQSAFVGDAPLPADNRVRDGVTQYRELLGKGRTRLLSGGKVGGVDTYKLKAVIERPGAGRGSEVEVVNIRKDNYRPLRVVYEVWEGKEQKSAKLKSEVTAFSDVQLVDRKVFDDSLFALEVPAGDEENITRTLTYDEVRSFNDFDLYYLGLSFNELKPGSFVYAKQGRRHRLEGVPDSRVMIDYMGSDGSNDLRLTIRPALKEAVISSVLSPSGRVTRTKVGGKTALLNEIKYDHAAFYRVFISAGDSTVEINGISKSAVLKAGGSLEKLNRKRGGSTVSVSRL